MDALGMFSENAARWFRRTLGEPTAVQEEAWPAIASGAHTLVSAPTGTGKTLAAFFVHIDRLLAEARQGTLPKELRVIYVSPLRSLAGDIRENLSKPLEGLGPDGAALRVAVRTGDTTQAERRKMLLNPPHILITTPESLYLLLSGKQSRRILLTARSIIIDELHSVVDGKRGAHLMLSIARLDKLCRAPLQRIGLSATIEPLAKAAEYLSPDPVTIVAPKMQKASSIFVRSPEASDSTGEKDAVWRKIARAIYQRCAEARTAIAFVDGRAYAEKLAFYVNEVAGKDFAKTHHGSVSKEQRARVEEALRSGELRLLCATSSMELGIDVGEIDMVFQVGCPRSVQSTMQRLGRAGHNPNRESVMDIYPRVPSEALYSGILSEIARRGGIEHLRPPRMCLDVLAQHLVSMASTDSYSVEEVMDILPRAHPFREVSKDDVKSVLRMLAGDWEHERDVPARPRILYDRVHGRVEGDAYSRMLAVSVVGTIPDKGLFSVRTQAGVKVGELDEEFVFEARLGDRFLLGSFSWQIADIGRDAVTVAPASLGGAKMPFWHGEVRGRRIETGIACGQILGDLERAKSVGALVSRLCELGLDEPAAKGASDLVERQLLATGALPSDRTVVIEHFRDENSTDHMVAHSVFGRPVNEPLAILLALQAKRVLGVDVGYAADDDGFLLFPHDESALPDRLLFALLPESSERVLSAILPTTPLFNMAFRYNLGRALLLGARKGRRLPLWVQRLRSSEMLRTLVREHEHPVIRETRRECLEDYWDLSSMETVLHRVRSGSIKVVETRLTSPSPMSLPLRNRVEAEAMYDYSPTPSGIHAAALASLEETEMISPAPEQIDLVSRRVRTPRDEGELHSLFMIEGDLAPSEIPAPFQWVQSLEDQLRVKYTEPGLFIASEKEEQYQEALALGDREEIQAIVRRHLRYRGPRSPKEISIRYLLALEAVGQALASLVDDGFVVEHEGLYYHADLWKRARVATVKARREEAKTYPAESYAALLGSRLRAAGSGKDALANAIAQFYGVYYPASAWERSILPARALGYRPEFLDALLSEGSIFWSLTPEGELAFHPYEDAQWEGEPLASGVPLEGDELVLSQALARSGASFTQRLGGALGGSSPYEVLFSLMEKGLVHADSFVPVRQWLRKEAMEKMSPTQRSRTRVMTAMSGRWELARPLRELSIEENLHRQFARSIILCRETLRDLAWADATRVLRTWEYVGRVRRGYFVEGMSGIQYMKEEDYAGALWDMGRDGQEVLWLPATDPSQPWGRCLPHSEGRSFLLAEGTLVALWGGMPVAVMERRGRTLRSFDPEHLPEALRIFAEDYKARRVFPEISRVTVKEYPSGSQEALGAAGFRRQMEDYVLYQGYR